MMLDDGFHREEQYSDIVPQVFLQIGELVSTFAPVKLRLFLYLITVYDYSQHNKMSLQLFYF